MHEHKNLSEIPAAACLLTVGSFELGSNGPEAKTAPVKLTARSGQPIEHWFWGRIVHDLAGMHLHKSRLAIDYVHDSKEIIGYLNHFDSATGDLVTSGALVPFKDSDRATEIIHKMSQGVPYEASINFGGDGIKIQDVGEGEVADVNGYQFEGPGVIVREWPLRGVAICPYGADMNTESSAFADNSKVFRATAYATQEADTEEGSVMSASVDVPAAAEAKAEELEQVKKLDQSVETATAEAAEVPVTVEEAPAETEEDVVKEPEAVINEPAALSREEFARIYDEFGAEIAAQTVTGGGDYQSALKASHDAMRAELAELKASRAGKPAKVASAPADPKAGKLFNTGR